MRSDTFPAALARRDAMRLAGRLIVGAGLSAALPPRLAWAAESLELMPNVRALIEKWVGPGKFPGLVATLGLPEREPEVVARGSEGFTDFDAMGADTLFRIYSMTKPVTGIATMILIGEGKLSLDQPLAEILPRYTRMTVQKVPDGPLDEVVPASAQITIRHLLTHTAGLGYTIIQKGPIKAAMEARGLIAGRISRIPVPGLDRGQAVPSLALFADRLAEMPLVYQPGTTWSYGPGLDLLGRVIEVVSGQPFDRFLKERIFDPCGMASTVFQVPASEAHRLATNYAAMGGVLAPIDRGEDSIYLDPPAFAFGGSGLVSSPRDYDRFLRLLAQEGTIGGNRVMSAAAVRLGTGDLLPEGVDTRGTFAMGGGFGAGGRVGRGAEAGLFGWAGAAGTVATVDMHRGLRSQFFAQFMPPDALPLLPEYQTALQDDVTDLINRGEKGA